MVTTTFPWYQLAARNGILVDTGVLLLHAFGLYENGRYFGRVLGDIPQEHGQALLEHLDGALRTFPSFMTPEVLAEFQGLAGRQGRLRGNQLATFLREYSLFPVREHYVTYTTLVSTKTEIDGWGFSYTDTSVVMAAKERNSPVLTNDRALRRLGHRVDVPVFHVYEDYFIHLP